MSKKAVTSLNISRKLEGIARVIVSPTIVTNTVDHVNAKINAIWDTGASHSAITARLAKKLGLKPVGKSNVTGVHGTQQVNVYAVYIDIEESGVAFLTNASEATSLGQMDFLIGMDIIAHGDFSIKKVKGKTEMAFDMDLPDLKPLPPKKVLPVTSGKEVGRNDKCPCGSGEKYKKCCGKK